METRISIDGKTATALADKGIYEKEAVMAAAYRLINRYSVEILEDGPDFSANFTQLDDQELDAATMYADLLSFFNDLLDEQLRLKLDLKSGRIRELIVQHAFSPIDLKMELA